MFRKFFLGIFFVFFLFPLYSLGGVLADSSSPLHVVRTEFFDIIFPEECRQSAQKIEAVCDDYYLEITKLLETEPYQRFPVTITRSVESLNAYYAAAPYNRIVLYDTLPEESLDMYENTIQQVFYHELTHAVTYNMKGSVAKALSFISDMMNPAWLSITTFWAEGATVSFESKGKGGRLNDPFFTQLANQSVIENRFPSWRDVTGARDTYPGGTDAYLFGSMFASYLQDKYGMSKYADFWKKTGSSLSLSFIAGVFKKTYGFNITDAWKDFEKTLKIESAEKRAVLLSKKMSRVTALDAFFDREQGNLKIAYFDTESSSLRLVTIYENGKIKNNRKLLAIKGVNRISFSPDGKKIALSRDVLKKNTKCIIAEYDLVKGRYKEIGTNGRRDGYFRLRDGKEELASVRIEGGLAGGNAAVLLKNDEIPFSPLALSDNLYAAIIKDGLSWKIRLFDGKNVLSDYDFSALLDGQKTKNLILHNLHLLSCDERSVFLSFSWAELGMGAKMLSRSGFIKIDRASLQATGFFQKENAFAGLIDSIPDFREVNFFEGLDFDSADEESPSFPVYLIAAEYDKKPLYRLEMKTCDFEKVLLPVKLYDFSGTNALADKNRASGNLEKEQPLNEFEMTAAPEISYNPFSYYKRGIFFPGLGLVPIYNHDFKQDSSTLLGLTFVSTNPWGDKQISFSGGYDFTYGKYGSQIAFTGGNDSFNYSLNGAFVFDKDEFMQTSESLQFAKVLWRGKVSDFSVGMNGLYLYGRQICDDELEKGRDDSIGKSYDLMTFLQFSNIHKISPAFYDYAGIVLKPFLLNTYRDTEKRFVEDKYLNAGLTAQVKFPLIIPFTFTATLFPTDTYVASGSVRAILFDLEIHRGIPALSLFVQRFLISATYAGKISYIHDEFWDCKRTKEILENAKKEDYSDSIKIAADFLLSPNTGFVANSGFQFSLGYALIYRPNPRLTEKRVAYGITASMTY